MFKKLSTVSVKSPSFGIDIFVDICIPQLHEVSTKKEKQKDGTYVERDVHSYVSDPAVSSVQMLETIEKYWGKQEVHDLFTSRFIKVVAMDRLRTACKEYVSAYKHENSKQPTVEMITKFAQDFLDQPEGWNHTLTHPETEAEQKKSAKKAKEKTEVLQELGVDTKKKVVSMDDLLASMAKAGITVEPSKK